MAPLKFNPNIESKKLNLFTGLLRSIFEIGYYIVNNKNNN